MERRQHDRLTRPGRRQSDRRPPAADHRRVLLTSPDEAWRLLNAYVFEEAGYTVYAAADTHQCAGFATRLLPDAIVVHGDVPDIPGLLAQLAATSNTCDIPVLIVTRSLHSSDALQARAAGAITLTVNEGEIDLLVDEVDLLIAAASRAQRTLKRRLLDLQELAQYYAPEAGGQALLRRLIDRLQVAIFALDEQGRCIAASDGATALTGYSRGQLLATTVFQAEFAGGQVSALRWRGFLAERQYTGTTTITNRAGEVVAVHTAAVAEIMPGFHIAAFAPA